MMTASLLSKAQVLAPIIANCLIVKPGVCMLNWMTGCLNVNSGR